MLPRSAEAMTMITAGKTTNIILLSVVPAAVPFTAGGTAERIPSFVL
jgi:hypothetical protein